MAAKVKLDRGEVCVCVCVCIVGVGVRCLGIWPQIRKIVWQTISIQSMNPKIYIMVTYTHTHTHTHTHARIQVRMCTCKHTHTEEEQEHFIYSTANIWMYLNVDFVN